MSEKGIKFIRWLIVITFLIAFVLNNIWQRGTYLWAYWVSRFLIGIEFSVFGFAFILFPKVMLRACTKNKEVLDGISGWKFMVIGLIAGIPISLLGINFLAIGVRRWLEECSTILNFFSCLPPVP